MKNRLFLLIAVAVAAACADATPTQPEGGLPSSPLHMSAATSAPVEIFQTFSHVVSPRVYTNTGEVTHSRGSEFAWILSGDVTGMLYATGTWLFHRDGYVTGQGKMVWEVTAPCEGTFEGNHHSSADPLFRGEYVVQGKGGCEGIIVKAEYEQWGSPYVVRITGTIHYANAQN